MLGPSVGRVVNDVSPDLAAGSIEARRRPPRRSQDGVAARQLSVTRRKPLPPSRKRRSVATIHPTRGRAPASLAPGWWRAGSRSWTRRSRCCSCRRRSLLFTLFVALPMGEAAWYSFYNWNGYGLPTQFVGWRNFELLFATRAFRHRADATTG